MKNQSICVLFAVLTSATSPAMAEDPSPLKGAWRLDFQTLSGYPMTGTLEVSDTSATWRATAKTGGQGKNPCFGRLFPADVAGDAAGGYRIDVHANATLAGCTDFTLTATVGEGNQLSGKLPDGRPVQMVRQ